MDIQALFDAMGEASKMQRSNYHLCLGELIKLLEENPDAEIPYGCPHSYRGYYSDLALERQNPQFARELLAELKEKVLDKELTGYKGGEFLMSADVPLWVATYGSCGKAVVSASCQDMMIEFITKNVD